MVDHEHNYVEQYTTQPTCTTEGEKVEKCIICSDVKTTPIEKLDHTPKGKGDVTTPWIQCQQDGVADVECAVCHQMFELITPAHTYGKAEVVVEPTCTEKGTSKATCKNCGVAQYKEIEELNHKYAGTDNSALVTVTASTTAPTCTENGVKTEICTLCKKTVKTTLKATGHNEEDKESAEEGLIKEIKKDGTVVLEEEEATSATCERDLVSVYYCSDCETYQVDVVEKATGHKFTSSKIGIIEYDEDGNPVTEENEEGDEYIVVKAGSADCTHNQVRVFTCKNDNCDAETATGESVVVIKKALGHTPDTRTIVRYGDGCVENQTRDYWCTTCKKQVYGEEIEDSKTGHNFEVVAANCTDGAHIACTKCEKTEVDFVGEEDTKAYNAFVKALTATDKATLCGEKPFAIENFLKAKGHTPRKTAAGMPYEPETGKFECSVCGEKYAKPATVTVEATTTENTDNLFGSTLGITDLQTDIAISSDGKVTGTLKYVKDFTQFNTSNSAEQKGYYLLLSIPEAKTAEKVTCKVIGGSGIEYPVDKTDGLIILRLTSAATVIEVKSGDKMTYLQLNLTFGPQA